MQGGAGRPFGILKNQAHLLAVSEYTLVGFVDTRITDIVFLKNAREKILCRIENTSENDWNFSHRLFRQASTTDH